MAILILSDDNEEEIIKEAIKLFMNGSGVGIDVSKVSKESQKNFDVKLDEELQKARTRSHRRILMLN